MFSGITETLGQVSSITSHQGCKDFVITPEKPFTDLNKGDSVAVNGVCLTVTEFNDKTFSVTAVPETLNLTNLNALSVHAFVNLERSMRLDQRLGGHFVQGHVDGTGKITKIQEEQGALRVTIEVPESMGAYLIPKGFIAIDGMSITLIDTAATYFTITFIPHTIQNTLVKYYIEGSDVNLEIDMLTKTIKKLLVNYS